MIVQVSAQLQVSILSPISYAFVNHITVHEEKEEKKGRFGGLKRLGTVLKGKRSSIQTPPSKNRKEVMRTESPAFSPQPAIREDDSAVSTPTREAIDRLGHSNERELPAAPSEPVLSPAPTNGARAELAGLQEPLQPSQDYSIQQSQHGNGAQSSQNMAFQSQQNNPYNSQTQQTFAPPPRTDSYDAPSGVPPINATATDGEGYSTPSAAFDPISQAEREANESASRQYDVDIRNAPIAEEDETAGAAITDLASTLRAVSPDFSAIIFAYHLTASSKQDLNDVALPVADETFGTLCTCHHRLWVIALQNSNHLYLVFLNNNPMHLQCRMDRRTS